jgi:hypothetical protein
MEFKFLRILTALMGMMPDEIQTAPIQRFLLELGQ